jgi:hypothetical protein
MALQLSGTRLKFSVALGTIAGVPRRAPATRS